MQPDRHQIQRQVIELTVDASAEAPAVQEALARTFWEHVVPELEAVFDRAAGADEVLKLDRLEIDLGILEGVDWEPQFRRKLVLELTRRLEQLRAVSLPPVPQARADAKSSRTMEQFLFFLVHGRLPWWGRTVSPSWSEALLTPGQPVDWQRLRATLDAHPYTRVRMIDSVSDEFLEAAIVAWAGHASSARLLERLAPRPISAHARTQWRRGFWAQLIAYVLAGEISPARGAQLVRQLVLLRASYEAVVDSDFTRERSAEGTPGRGRRMLEGIELPHPWSEWRKLAEETDVASIELRESRTSTEIAKSAPEHSAPQQVSDPSRKTDSSIREGEAIYLTGVGAILLHPFLEELFRERGLLAGRELRDDAARHRAVHLLARLCFGEVEVPEHDLLLAKLLCSLPFEEPLEPVELDESDRAACDGLLHAVLRHWTALRSDSLEWLRANFFLRDGKLEAVNSGWRLTVERRAQDVLLARLPWGLGVIGLPWLKERIFVRWLD